MILKFKLAKKVMIEETEDGVPIRPFQGTPFQKGMQKLRANKERIYNRMEKQSNDPKVQAYYENPKNTFDDVDQEIS